MNIMKVICNESWPLPDQSLYRLMPEPDKLKCVEKLNIEFWISLDFRIKIKKPIKQVTYSFLLKSKFFINFVVYM